MIHSCQGDTDHHTNVDNQPCKDLSFWPLKRVGSSLKCPVAEGQMYSILKSKPTISLMLNEEQSNLAPSVLTEHGYSDTTWQFILTYTFFSYFKVCIALIILVNKSEPWSWESQLCFQGRHPCCGVEGWEVSELTKMASGPHMALP